MKIQNFIQEQIHMEHVSMMEGALEPKKVLEILGKVIDKTIAV